VPGGQCCGVGPDNGRGHDGLPRTPQFGAAGLAKAFPGTAPGMRLSDFASGSRCALRGDARPGTLFDHPTCANLTRAAEAPDASTLSRAVRAYDSSSPNALGWSRADADDTAVKSRGKRCNTAVLHTRRARRVRRPVLGTKRKILRMATTPWCATPFLPHLAAPQIGGGVRSVRQRSQVPKQT
jgi:hypothetical protein